MTVRMSYSFSWGQVREEVLRIPQSLEREVILQMSQVAYDEIQREADKHTVSGALFDSVYNRQVDGGREVGHDPKRAPHARWVVFGSRPHVIKPKERKALRWPSGDRFAFARAVNHPGYSGDDYMTRGADAALNRFYQIVNDLNV